MACDRGSSLGTLYCASHFFFIHMMEDRARQKSRFTSNEGDFVQSKPLFVAMMAALNESQGPCATFLKEKGAMPDTRHISGSNAVYYNMLWPTACVDAEVGGTTAG